MLVPEQATFQQYIEFLVGPHIVLLTLRGVGIGVEVNGPYTYVAYSAYSYISFVGFGEELR